MNLIEVKKVNTQNSTNKNFHMIRIALSEFLHRLSKSPKPSSRRLLKPYKAFFNLLTFSPPKQTVYPGGKSILGELVFRICWIFVFSDTNKHLIVNRI